MTKPFRKLSNSMAYAHAALAVATLAWASSAHAGVVQLNTDGTGYAGANNAIAATNVRGSGFVLTQPDTKNPMSFLFSETGAYELTQADGVSSLGSRDVTLTYSVLGAVNPLTGALSISGGMFSLYSDANTNFGTASNDPSVVFGANDGTLMASFRITSGGGTAGGNVSVQGQAIADTILPGYFFSESGADLSVSGNIMLDFVLGNALNFLPSQTEISELVCKAAAFTGPGCDGSAYSNSPYYFLVKDGGAATLSTSIPEPGSQTLAFIGLAAMGVVSRRKFKN